MKKEFIKNKTETIEIDGSDPTCLQIVFTDKKFPGSTELINIRNRDIPKLLESIKKVKPEFYV